MNDAQNIPDDITAIFGAPKRLVDRQLAEYFIALGPKGEFVRVAFIHSKAAPA